MDITKKYKFGEWILYWKLNPKWSITLRLTGLDADNLFKKLS